MFDEREMYRLQRECDFDRWYEALKDVTMRTEFIPLSMEESGAILEGGRSIEGSLMWKQVDKILEQNNLRALAAKLGALIATFPEGAFARLGTRSPKDSKLIEARGMKFLQLANSPRSPPQDFNEELIQKLRAQIAGLRVRTTNELFELFFTSERIRDDLEETLEHGDTPTIVLRAFEDIDPTTELRLFVKNRQIIAASQYNYLIRSDLLLHVGEQYLQAARDLHACITDRLTLQSYIFDVGFLGGYPEHPRLIEINPYCIGTSACLLSWRDDFAMGTKIPAQFEFRVRTQALKRE